MDKAHKKEIKQVAKKKAQKTIRKSIPKHILLMSEYLQTILQPETVYGYKIPDPDTSLSFTAHCRQIISVPGYTGSATPNCISALAMTVGSLGATLSGATGPGSDYWTGNSDGTATGITWTPFQKQYASTLSTKIASTVRPVSASICGAYQASTLNDQGQCIIGFIPGPALGNNSIASLNTILANTIQALSYPFVNTIPAAKRFARALYLPTDAWSMSYSTAGNGNYPSRIGNATSAATTGGGTQYGLLFIIFNGLAQVTPPTSNVVEFTMTENFEAIPTSISLGLFTPSPSKSDPLELSMVANKLADKPMTSVMQTTAKALTQTAVEAPVSSAALNKPSHKVEEKTFFERVLDGVEKYGPLVARGAELVGSML